MARKETAFEKAQRLMNEKGLTAEQAASRTGVNVGRLQPSTTSMTINGFTPQTSQVVSGTPYDSPTGAYTTYQTQLPGGQQAYSQNEIGAAGQQYLADYLAGNTTGSFADWQAAGGYKGGGTAAAAPAAAAGGGQQKQKTARQGGGLRSQLKGMTTDRNLGRKEVKSLLGDYTPQQIVNQFQKLGGKAGLGGGAANLLTKAIQQSPFGNISLAGQNLGMRGFQEGGITEALRGMVGTQRPERNPQSGRTMIGTPGTGPLSRGMQIGPGGQVRAKPQRQAPIAAAPAIAQQGAGEAASSTAAPSTTVMDDFGMAGPSDGDQQYMNMLADFQSALGEMMGGYQTQQQQLMEQFGSMFDNVMNAEAPRLYGVGQNYNIDPIRLAQMLRSRPRSSYMRGAGGALNPMSIASALAPALSGLSAGGVNI